MNLICQQVALGNKQLVSTKFLGLLICIVSLILTGYLIIVALNRVKINKNLLRPTIYIFILRTIFKSSEFVSHSVALY